MHEIEKLDGIEHLSVDIDKNDVVVIAVSQMEMRLNAVVKDRTKLANDTEKQAAGVKAKLEEELKHMVDLEANPHVETILGGFKMLGRTIAVGRTYGVQLTDGGSCTLSAGFSEMQDSYHKLTCHVTVKATPEQKARIERHNELLAQAAEDRAQAVDARRKLANMGFVQRRAMAKLAERSLMQKKGGAELLALITSDLEEQLKALPGS